MLKDANKIKSVTVELFDSQPVESKNRIRPADVKFLSYTDDKGRVYEVWFELVTPERAAELLKFNTRNRRLNKRRVDKYAHDMTKKAFLVNGDSARFDHKNVLLDGQKRISAVIKAGVPQLFLMVWGIKPEAQRTMDDAQGRTLAGQLQIKEEKNSGIRAHCITQIWHIRKGCEGGLRPFAEEQLIEKQYRDSLDWICNAKLTRPFSRQSIAGTLAYIHHKHPELADTFKEALRTGANLPVGSPVMMLMREVYKWAGRSKEDPETYIKNSAVKLSAMGSVRVVMNAVLAFSRKKKMTKPDVSDVGWDYFRALDGQK